MRPSNRIGISTTAFVWAILATSLVARAQSLDPSFDPGANAYVSALAVQADGKILVGGFFTTLGGGGTGTTARNYIGRLNADGSLDPDFNPGANGRVSTLVVQSDGKILVGGAFTTLGGGGTGTTTRHRIGRLNADGSLDATFNPGANGEVFACAVQADRKIVLGGWFTMLGGGGTGTTPRHYLGRLNADGSLDTGFNPGANGTISALAVQADRQILVGGSFQFLGGGGTGATPRYSIGRLNADGSIDASFNPGAAGGVFALVEQVEQPQPGSSGKVLVGGDFSTLGGGGRGTTTRNSLGRLNADGSVDTSFDPGANRGVNELAVQADGKILVGGNFTLLGGGGTGTTPRNKIGRLNADGSLDTNFDPGANDAVSALAVQADGRILVGGYFTTLGGGGTGTTTRNRIGRLLTTSPTSPSGLTGSASASAITLSWLAPTTGAAPSAYRIEAGSAAGLKDLADFSTGTPATTFSASGVANGLYFIRVRAITATGTSGASNEIPLRVGPAPPGAPSGLTGSASGSTLTLSWTAPQVTASAEFDVDEAAASRADADPVAGGVPSAYLIEAGSASGLLDLANFSTGSAATTFAAPGVSNGVYYLRVRATNSAGTSGASNEVAVRVGTPLEAPGVPIGLTASATGASITLSWTAPTTGGAPTAYTIDVGNASGLTNLTSFSTGSPVTTFGASGVSDGRYYVRVRATNGAGTSGPSNEAVLVVGCTAAPGTPSGFHVAAQHGGTVSFAWTAPGAGTTTAPATYLLEAGSTSGGTEFGVFDLGSPAATYTATGVGPGTYHVRIRAKNACGTSTVSNEVVLIVS